MSILWAGAEDIDFPNGGTITVGGNGGASRSGYARHSLGATAGAWSLPFAGGAVTSCWFSFRISHNPRDINHPILYAGLVDSTSLNASGLWIGNMTTGTNATNRVAIHKFNGTAVTELAAAGIGVMDGSMHKFDVQLISYGATATVNVYVDGSLNVTFTGDVRVGSVTSVNSVGIVAMAEFSCGVSELFVADEDTRAFVGLVTMAPTGAGTTDQWTGAYTDVNEATKSDATMVYTNTATQDEQFNITDLPAGNFNIKAVVAAARVTSPTGSTATKVALGFNSGGSVAVGTSQTATTAWDLKQQIFATNPVTSANWALSEMNALQLNLRSGS